MFAGAKIAIKLYTFNIDIVPGVERNLNSESSGIAMKVHICDFCKTIINNPIDRNIVKVKKRTPSIDFATGWEENYFWNNKYTLCTDCYEKMCKFIVDSAPANSRSKPKSSPKGCLSNFARMKRAKSAKEMAEILVEPYIKKHPHKYTLNLITQRLLDWLEAEVKE